MKRWKLVPNWKRVVKHAWSLRLNILLSVASAVDAGISYWVDGRASASLMVMAASLAASVARLVKQETVSGAGDGE